MTEQNIFLKNSGQLVVAAVLFYATGWLAMLVAPPPAYIGIIWPPAGIGLAAVLLWGYRVLPGIFLATILLYLNVFDLAALWDSPQKLMALCSVCACAVLRAWLGTILVKRFAQFPYTLVTLRTIGLFFVLAGPVAAFVPAALTVFALHVSGIIMSSDIYSLFLKTWLADCTGVVIFIPLLFIVFERSQRIWQDRIITLGLPLVLYFLVTMALSLYFQQKNMQYLLLDGALLPVCISVVLLALTGYEESIKIAVDERTEELTQSNRKLRSRDRQFNKLVQTQSVIVWRAHPVSFRFVYVNDEAKTILGYPISLWKNEPDFWWEHIHDDDKDRVQAFCAEERKPRDVDLEYRMITADGDVVWLRDIFTKVVSNGVVSELYGLMIDITKQKLAEEEFRVAAITFESQQGIMITDSQSKIIRVNKAFTDITGFTLQEVIGQEPKLLKSGRHDQTFYKNFWQQLMTVGMFEGEVWNRRKNGEIYPEWQIVTAVENNGEVTHYVSVFSDITQKKEAEDKIHSLAFYDALTGLPNRRLLLDRFEQEIAIARRHKQFGAVIFLDLDHFKLLNDSQGHLVGDELLIQVANRLSSVLREEDTPARLGGDEFVVLLHANSENLSEVSDHARTVAEKIRKQLNTPFLLHHYQHQISTSIGITLFPEGDESPDMILQQADTAMYRSKAGGRNAISFFQPSMQEAADQRLKLEQYLRTAIDKEGFMLFFQPQVDRSGVMLGAEVLIRWEQVEQGIVSPADFISVAEESSLILDIGLWVLKKTCQQIKEWLVMGIHVPRMSVNVSSRQFRQPDFVEQIKAAISDSQIPPALLGIELTESVMIVDIDDTVTKMKALKKLGVSIAIDDFGTGYSSLAYLKRLPLDVLKIDRGFVRDILTDTNDAVIVETIISMARHLKLRVIAEGVETEDQFDVLKKQGCLMFQGYHFSRPLSAVRFAEKYLANL
ncbi:putative Diguanylate cyclase [Crenothrix polyspora]|uniref:Putative Diguanylate cyclase n=1 Tax=Crenothrix polyspora TaxID=360316 RepID=A0A1R4H2T9_9GAMM|nr:EAL domain-containing protein [Crenothrix polyspora]SJM90575.1 putative Diguanylate cyclase [Crenothrix polyspora]